MINRVIIIRIIKKLKIGLGKDTATARIIKDGSCVQITGTSSIIIAYMTIDCSDVLLFYVTRPCM